MGIFQDVKMEWNGKEYVIPQDRVLQAIAVVEEHFTVPNLLAGMGTGNIKLAKLSLCVGDMLRFAGCEVTNDEVYSGLLQVGKTQENIIKTIQILVTMMIPPEQLAQINSEDNSTVKKPVRKRRIPAKRSRRSTKS